MGIPQGFFRTFAFADVTAHSHHALGIAGRIVDNLPVRLHPGKTSICSYLPIFRVILAVALKRLPNRVANPWAVFAVNAFQKCFDISSERSRKLPMDSFHVFRPPDTPSFDVPIPCADIGGIQAEEHSLFAVSQRLFDLPDPRDVPCDFGGAHDPARGISNWRNR